MRSKFADKVQSPIKILPILSVHSQRSWPLKLFAGTLFQLNLFRSLLRSVDNLQPNSSKTRRIRDIPSGGRDGILYYAD